MKKIKVADKNIQNIKDKIKEKGWTLHYTSPNYFLIEVNKYKFKKIVEEKLKKDFDKISEIKKEDFEKIEEEFTDSSYKVVHKCFEEQECVHKNKILDLFETIPPYSKRESCINLKKVIRRNFDNFTKAKEIDIDIFQLFCEVLDIPWWSLLPEDSPEYKLHSKNNILSEELKLFDHERQVNLLRTGLFEQKIFIVNNKCNCSLTWMLRRLEAEIYSFHQLKFRHFTPNKNKSRYLSSAKYHETVFNEIDIKYLKEENILIVLEIENYEQIRSIILSYWQSFIKEIPNENKGKLAMFLIAEKPNVDIYDDLQTHVIELSTEIQYDVEGIAGLICKIADRCKHTSLEEPRKIANKLISDCQDKPLDLLKVIYQNFSVERDKNWMKLWTEYP
ncbi:MAG: hypothetical protein QNJ49_08755 [Mastigocoleus sp. MO_167.B18]|nr:hypothetical protein [Mastigocoleus sp. MO_167.B18]